MVLIFITFTLLALTKPNNKTTTAISVKSSIPTPINANPKIQVAVLLDVSSSMDGLIEQAKSQLWNMVSVMGKAQCNGVTPQIEIALYEYGRSSNKVSDGYVKQINGFTGDLDQLSKNLFSLTTNGGDEYCGQVIYKSLTDLSWDAASSNYKVIFIAGNEDFLQGNISYTKACEEARKKGVIVNTIYCGDRQQGINEHWNLAGECGSGSFTNINSDARIQEIPTPYDSTLFVLNGKLNRTYISYGYEGVASASKQESMDLANVAMSKSAGLKRIAVKGNSSIYKNDTWDMIDASAKDSMYYTRVDMKTLPDSLKNKTRAELKQVIKSKTEERNSIQKNIASLNIKRDNYITAEKAKASNKNNSATLETEVEKMIRLQAKRFNMIIN